MKENQVVCVEVNDWLTVQGSVARIYHDKRVAITTEMIDKDGSTLTGFHRLMTEQYTLRKDGSWVRRGVMTGRGWKVIPC